MAYGTPADPVSGTVITVSYAVANILNPIRALRQFTGGADPPGSSYLVVSNGDGTTSWKKVPTDAIEDNAITTPKIPDGNVTSPKMAPNAARGNLGYVPANVVGDTFLGQINITTNAGTGNNFNALQLINTAGGNSGVYLRFISGPSSAMSLGMFVGNYVFAFLDVNGASAFYLQSSDAELYLYGHKLWHAGNLNPAALTDAVSVAGRVPGLGAGNLAYYNGAVRVADSENLGGHPSSYYAAATSVPATIPSGLVAMVRLASEIPSGWVRETRLDGRMPVGAGQATGITSPALFNEDTDYGASWTHAHGMTNHTHDMGGHMHSTPAHGHATPNHGHGVTALTVTGALGAATGSDQANAISPGTSFALGTHTHANGTLDVGGSIGSDGASSTNGTDGGGTSGPVGVVTSVGPVPGNTSSDVWLIPSHSYVYCRKT